MVTGMDKMLSFAEYLYEDDEGEKYTIVEAHPNTKESKLEEIGVGKITWAFVCGSSLLPNVLEKSTKFRNKHVFMVSTDDGSKVLVGFHPKLTDKQREDIKSIVVDSQPEM